MPVKDIKEAPQIDEASLKMLEDHSCCGPVQAAVEAADAATAVPGDAPAFAGASQPKVEEERVGEARHRTSKSAQRFSFKMRLAGFGAVALVILGTALWLVRPMDVGAQMADYTVEMSMSGFTPPSLEFPVGKAVTVKLVNKESPFHASGAEHQFAVDALGINELLDAKQTKVITIPAQQAGQYTFYCDVCCGGQKSPTMRGTLTFREPNTSGTSDTNSSTKAAPGF